MVNRHGPKAASKVHALVREAGIEVENVTPRHAQIAIGAFAIYGKGSRHKAGLNYGDCLFTRWQKPQDCRSFLKVTTSRTQTFRRFSELSLKKIRWLVCSGQNRRGGGRPGDIESDPAVGRCKDVFRKAPP